MNNNYKKRNEGKKQRRLRGNREKSIIDISILEKKIFRILGAPIIFLLTVWERIRQKKREYILIELWLTPALKRKQMNGNYKKRFYIREKITVQNYVNL